MVATMKEQHQITQKEIRDTTEALVKQIKWRIEDCETLVKSRITENYVQDLGKTIERGIIDSFERKTKETIDTIAERCKIIEDNNQIFANSVDDKLELVNEKMDEIKKEMATKATN